MSTIHSNVFTGLYVGALFHLTCFFCHFPPLFQSKHMLANQQWAIRQQITQDVVQIEWYRRISLFIASSNVFSKATATRQIVSFYFQRCIKVIFILYPVNLLSIKHGVNFFTVRAEETWSLVFMYFWSTDTKYTQIYLHSFIHAQRVVPCLLFSYNFPLQTECPYRPSNVVKHCRQLSVKHCIQLSVKHCIQLSVKHCIQLSVKHCKQLSVKHSTQLSVKHCIQLSVKHCKQLSVKHCIQISVKHCIRLSVLHVVLWYLIQIQEYSKWSYIVLCTYPIGRQLFFCYLWANQNIW